MDSPTILRTAHVLGITSSAFLSGYAFAASQYAIPAANLAPLPLRLRQWLVVYDRGKLVSPTVALAAGLLWSYLAFASYHDTSSRRLADWTAYAAAGAFTFGILPWTIIALMPTNHVLIDAANAVQSGMSAFSEAESKRLEGAIATWATLNWFRAVTPIIGAAVAVWAILP